MKHFFWWPVIIGVLRIVDEVYERTHPCNTGFITVGCGLGTALVDILIIESLIVYVVLFGILYYVVTKSNGIMLPWYVSIAIGLATAGMAFGGITMHPTLLIMSAPYYFGLMNILRVLLH